ncbi:MAG: hypothetical protein IPN17_19090 [Deltaproteobacteria bacterium]|jgi:hypothetical protein|nr:hypothetical protein [Deltaproteobacteria bacterium]MBP6834217.1 hypothetical protein [Deltaproteobacteria bacterium]
MTRSPRLLLLVLAAFVLDACASAPPPPPQVASRPRRRRRRPAADAAPTATAATVPSIGSPVVQAPTTDGHTLTPRWTGPRSAPRIVCEGDALPQRPSTQSPYDPTNAMIVRAFLPVERQVLACSPPVDREGRVPVRVLFAGSGLPLEVSLASDVSRAQGLCLGAALCNVRLAAFRAPNAMVNYSFVAAVAADGPAAP